MQNRYVGDIGDFGKYGLLRALAGLYPAKPDSQCLLLGIAWYLFPDESHNADGKFVGYLNPIRSNRTKFRACDPQLYDELRNLVDAGNRDVSAIRQSGILPQDTSYHENSLSYVSGESRPARQVAREEWLDEALAKTSAAEIVYLDPDNGISATVDRYRKTGPKYVYLDDLEKFAQRGQSTVIYHHLSRQGTAQQQIALVSSYLLDSLKLAEPPKALRYRRGTARVFFLIAQPDHRPLIEKNLSLFLRSPWQQHFQLAS